MEKELKLLQQKNHPIFKIPKTFGEKASDVLTKIVGSWTFIFIFLCFLGVWMITEGYFILRYISEGINDPFPFILLNLVLAAIAAIQAPIILMSQNRQEQRDRIRAEYDYAINKKAEKEIEFLMKEVKEIKRTLQNCSKFSKRSLKE